MILLTWQYNPMQAGRGQHYHGNHWNQDRGCNCTASANISEDKENYKVEMAVPGFNKEDIHISLENDVLTITSELKPSEQNNGSYMRREFGLRNFERSFTLPDTVAMDDISAAVDNGILTVTIPKKEEFRLKKEIQIA